jgi:3-oxoacyl-(acyl-carrier-protein) synthase
MSQAQRVLITGVGSLTNLGIGLDSLKQAIEAPRGHFCSVPDDWLQYKSAPHAFMASLDSHSEVSLKPFETVSTDRATAMALHVADQAWTQAGLGQPNASERAGVYWGTGMGGLHTLESSYQRLLIKNAALRPMTVVRVMANSSAAQLALKYKLQGTNQTFSVACASSAIALGEAMWAIRSGRFDYVLVGGSEAMLVPMVMAAWGALHVMALKSNTKDPQLPCRPFSSDRSGLVIGEGAACFVLESERHANARGAAPLAELAGYASNCDAASLVHPGVDGQVRVMRQALSDAGLQPSDIDSINAHATGTDAGDVTEAHAFEKVFTDLNVPVAATKAMHGHLLGAAGAVEAAMCVASLQTQKTPATLGLRPQDERCNWVSVAEHNRGSQIKTILSNSFAFGGSNASLIFRQT